MRNLQRHAARRHPRAYAVSPAGEDNGNPRPKHDAGGTDVASGSSARHRSSRSSYGVPWSLIGEIRAVCHDWFLHDFEEPELACARSRPSRRRRAASKRRLSSSVSGRTGGTDTGLPFSSSATKVRYADDVWWNSPVLRSSTHSFTPTSIDELKTRFTLDFRMST